MLYRSYGDRADFVFVYVAEAHADDEWQLPANLEEDAVLNQQTTLAERRATGAGNRERLGLGLPLLLDEMDNRASTAFAAWPERLVLVGPGRADRRPGQSGPVGFLPKRRESSSGGSSAARGHCARHPSRARTTGRSASGRSIVNERSGTVASLGRVRHRCVVAPHGRFRGISV